MLITFNYLGTFFICRNNEKPSELSYVLESWNTVSEADFSTLVRAFGSTGVFEHFVHLDSTWYLVPI
jgi:hypothetical protein